MILLGPARAPDYGGRVAGSADTADIAVSVDTAVIILGPARAGLRRADRRELNADSAGIDSGADIACSGLNGSSNLELEGSFQI